MPAADTAVVVVAITISEVVTVVVVVMVEIVVVVVVALKPATPVVDMVTCLATVFRVRSATTAEKSATCPRTAASHHLENGSATDASKPVTSRTLAPTKQVVPLVHSSHHDDV